MADRGSSRFSLRGFGIGALFFFVALWTAWASGALFYDGNTLVAAVFGLLALTALIRFRRRALLGLSMSLVAITTWWFLLAPSNQRNWQRDVAELGWAEVQGDQVRIHNVRHFEYRTETEYTPGWETRTVRLSELRAVDVYTSNWGPQLIAHAIVSFAFADGQYVAMSIEARKEVGETYSAVAGFFRQYELIYIASDERDVVRLRTNYREGETVRLYRTMTRPDDARRLFLEYVGWMNAARTRPEWYNAFTRNCSTPITNFLSDAHIGGISKWSWGTVFNGRGDQMLYDLGDLQSGGLPFADLAKQAVINEAAKQADTDADFSRRIREGRVGFEPGTR